MRASKIYLTSWMFIALISLIVNLLIGITFIVSGFLLNGYHSSSRMEYSKQTNKEVSYVG